MTGTARRLLGAIALLGGLVLVGCAGGAGTSPDAAPEPTAFDRDATVQRARDLLGRDEADVVEDRMTRIVRRGDEDLPVTMDLVPGRLNVELDPAEDGSLVVTRVVAEVPDDEDPIVVE